MRQNLISTNFENCSKCELLRVRARAKRTHTHAYILLQGRVTFSFYDTVYTSFFLSIWGRYAPLANLLAHGGLKTLDGDFLTTGLL